MTDEPRDMVERRVRNARIEYFELASSFAMQLEYRRKVPIADVTGEVICQWSDHWTPAGFPPEVFDPRIYSPDEVAAVHAFHRAWESVTNALPKRWIAIDEVQQLPAWAELRDAALTALSVFAVRGKT